MGEHFPAQIDIGGDVPRRLIPELIQAICDDGLHDPDDESLRCEFVDEYDMLEYIADMDVEYLRMADYQASYGDLPHVREFLVRHQIPFDLLSDHHHEFDGQLIQYRAGWSDTRVDDASANGAVMVPRAAVQRALELLTAGQPEACLLQLRGLAGVDIPDLPPFRIVD